ncbi:MAG: PD40 domain-containing protein [Anaerolineaceae bacterium]|nr:PD40 domain-containing protein [Anaerolineaceae bacterium]
MQIKKTLTALLVVASLITGCTSHISNPSTESNISPTNTEQPHPETKTPVQTPTKTVQPTEEGFQYEPFSQVQQLSDKEALFGTFVLSESSEEGLYLLDAKSMQMTELQIGYISASEVSPDQTLFAYESYTYENGAHVNLGIDIIDDSGEIQQHVNSDGMTHSFMWINPTDLIFNLGGENAPILRYTLSNQAVDTIYPYYDPSGYHFTGYDHFYGWEFFIIHKNVHNPAFTRIVYPFADSRNQGYVLRDTENDINLAELLTDDSFTGAPKWSRVGDKFAIGGDMDFSSNDGFEIIIVDSDGNVLLTTDFATLSKSFDVNYLSWSPDGQTLAFSCSINPVDNYKEYRLGILELNTASSEVFDIPIPYYCPQLWSPDSRFILFQNDEMASGEDSIFLFDTENQELVQLIDGYIPIGWLQSSE